MATGGCSNKDHLNIAFGSIYLFLAVIASVEQGFFLCVVKRDPFRQFNKPTNIFNTAIGINYLLGALIGLPLIGIHRILKSQHVLKEPSVVVKLFEDFFVCFLASNGIMLAFALSIERSTAFIFPVLNRKHVTMTRVKRTCTVITGICFLLSCILFTGVPHNIFYFMFLPLLILLPSLGLLVLPIAGFHALKRQARKVDAAKRDERLSCPTNNRKDKTRRDSQMYRYLLQTTMFAISIVTPLVFYCVVKILKFSDADFVNTSCFTLLEHLAFLLLFLLAVVSPVVFMRKIPIFWRSVRHIWKRR